MKKNLKILLLTAILQFGLGSSQAQESILDDVNYVLLDTLIAKAKTNYPRNAILSNKTALAKNNVIRANVAWLDAFNFNYIYGNNSLFNIGNPTGVVNGYQVGFNVNLGLILDKPFRVKNAKKEHTIAQLEEKEYALLLKNEVKKRYFMYLQYLSSLKILTKSSQDANSAAQDLKYKYEKGEVTFELYNNALRSLAAATQAKVETEAALFIAKASLEELIGQPLEEININGRK